MGGLVHDHLLANRDDELRSVRLVITWHPNPRAVPYTGQGEVQEVFEGTAREAGRLYPRTLNFVVAIALAGLGLDRTEVRILLDPDAVQTAYRLEIDAATTGLRAEVELRRPDRRGSGSARPARSPAAPAASASAASSRGPSGGRAAAGE